MRRKWLLGGASLLGAVLLAGVGLALAAANAGHGPKDMPAGTGYAAWDLCTRTMQSGEALERVRTRYIEPKVDPLPRIWRIDYRPGAQVTVESVLPGMTNARTALFRRGLGCSLVPPETSVAAVRAQPFQPVHERAADARAWPLGDGAVEAALLAPGARALIERHATLIFSEPNTDPKRQRNATALLVARDGHLVYERYGEGHTRAQPQLGWSMTKSLTAILAGVLARDGKLGLDAPVGLARWNGTPKQAITWRQLLNMAPGLAWDEGYGGASDATQMLFSEPDQGGWAADRPLTSKPGSVFTYSTGTSTIAMLGLRQLLGGTHQAIYDYYQTRLFQPLGIRGGVVEPDASGTPVGGARGILRPVDWLRLGQLIANGGTWDGTALLAPEWVSFMTAASPANAGYGGSMWRWPTAHIPAGLRARLPEDLVFFAGHMGQHTVIVPSRGLVVLRMGATLEGTMEDDVALQQVLALVADLLAAG